MTLKPFLRSTIAILVTGAGLAALDVLLARTERREVQGEAAEAFRQGSLLLTQRKPELAVARLRKAWILERGNPAYELQLGNALFSVGKLNEAEPLISDVLDRQPDDGEANLAAARLMVRKDSPPEATSYFHRAVYGEWTSDPATKRVAARLELIEYLAERKRRQEMLAELISLDAETIGQTSIRHRLAHFYLLAGSPARAAYVYRELDRQDPSDVDSVIGLGEAELQSGNYRAARSAFVRAAMRNPGVPIQSRLQLVDTLTALDPTPRQLTSTEKYRRSIRILELVRANLDQLLQSNPAGANEETTTFLKRSGDELSKKEPAHPNNEMAEGILMLAQDLWRIRTRIFGPAVSQEEEPLPLLMDRLKS